MQLPVKFSADWTYVEKEHAQKLILKFNNSELNL